MTVATWSGFDPAYDQGDGRPFHDYLMYGIAVRSELPLAFPEDPPQQAADVTLFRVTPEWFARNRNSAPQIATQADACEHVSRADGWDYVRWPELCEFAISPDGRTVACGWLGDGALESFQTYFLGQVLSFALVKQGQEPLHATTVVADGQAIAFLADCGQGKSTLAAAFLRAGHRVLTDDLLLIREVDGVLQAFPGPPRLKLFPETAAYLLREHAGGTPMHPMTAKEVIPLAVHQHHTSPAPIRRFFLLESLPSQTNGARIEALPGAASFLQLVRSTFNVRVLHAERLRRQFQAAREWSRCVPVQRLSYRRTLATLDQVCETVLSDLRRPATLAS